MHLIVTVIAGIELHDRRLITSITAAGEDKAMSGDCDRYRLLIHSARQLVQVTAAGHRRLTGARQMNSLAVMERQDGQDGQGVSVVVDR